MGFGRAPCRQPIAPEPRERERESYRELGIVGLYTPLRTPSLKDPIRESTCKGHHMEHEDKIGESSWRSYPMLPRTLELGAL